MKVSHPLLQLTAIGCLSLLILPVGTRAETQVETRVNARAESGGQIISDETVGTGDQSVEVRVETIVNGEAVKPVNLKLPAKDGSTTVTLEQSTSASTGAAPESQTEVTVNGQPVQIESPLPLSPAQPSHTESSSLIETLVDWIKEIWRSITNIFT